MSGLINLDDPQVAGSPGVAEFDAGFLYGVMFSQALEDARIAIDRVKRRRILKLAKGAD
jgi:hypothetical protein